MRGDHLVELMDRGVKNFVLELYDTGTANLRDSPYSLRQVLPGRPGEGRAFLLHLAAGGHRGFLPLRHLPRAVARGGHPHGPAHHGVRVDEAGRVLCLLGDRGGDAGKNGAGKCGRLSLSSPGRSAHTVTLCGWVHRDRDLGGVSFVVLRDRSGSVPARLRREARRDPRVGDPRGGRPPPPTRRRPAASRCACRSSRSSPRRPSTFPSP